MTDPNRGGQREHEISNKIVSTGYPVINVVVIRPDSFRESGIILSVFFATKASILQ